MHKLIGLCGSELQHAREMWDGMTTSDLVAHIIEYADWCLCHDKFDLKDKGVTHEWLAGHVSLVISKIQLKAHLASLVQELPEASATRIELLRVFDYVRGSGQEREAARDHDPGNDAEM